MAGGWDDSYCCAGTVYVHHRVYCPPRYRHISHVHAFGPRHVNVVDYPFAQGCCTPVYSRLGWLRPAYWSYYRPYDWPWRGRRLGDRLGVSQIEPTPQ